MATGKDVADLAGTSTAVVSYVFNNGPRNVSPNTRERVLQAAARLNYRPNALARALSHGRTASIGLVVPDIANRFFGELARALQGAAATLGDLLLIGDSGLDAERERAHIAAFAERRVDATVLVSLSDEPDIAPLTDAGVPVLALQPVPAGSRLSSLSVDYRRAARAMTMHLIDHGYDSIALLSSDGDSAGVRQHRSGFRAAVRAAGRELTATEIRSPISRAETAEVFAAVLSSGHHPRAVYCTTDEQAHGVLFACARAGLRVPADVAVTGFDATEHSAFSWPPLTSVRQPIDDLAESALEMLRRGPEPTHGTVPFELVVRDSCGPHD
ncbi:LacI family transcriptional regulator [Microbacterium esteraromaticum]|uniref:LacI family transcriptional regulator n=1 Tax=Microbacterium esteraromaticum TaxID=57043 RepID=A0A7D8AJX0_9MICO|nr:LacI family DNA-binding transcriptional regulator [Microbacterium esteraromaticum]QMU96267.1 LacI family transcriptional regulator [Microbacterium esteraromaticum]